MNAQHTPGTQVAVVYERGDSLGHRTVLAEREFNTVQAATNWVTPYILAGHPFDICKAEYLNEKRAALAKQAHDAEGGAA